MIEFLHGWFPVPSDVIFNVLSIFDKRSSVGGDRYSLEHHKRHITALNGVSFRLNHNSIILNQVCVRPEYLYSSGFQRMLSYNREKHLKNSEKCRFYGIFTANIKSNKDKLT